MRNNRRISLLVLLLMFAAGNTLAQKSVQAFSVQIEVTDDVSAAKVLTVGVDPTATDDIDIALGESELPPMPPSGNFEARLILPFNNFSGSLNSWSDYRASNANPYTGQIKYRLHYQKTSTATYMIVRWNLPTKVTGVLKDIVTGTIISSAMSGSGEFKVTNPTSFNKLDMILDFQQVSTGVEDDNSNPLQFSVQDNYPNPFNPSTKISYTIPRAADVSVEVYNANMELVATLHDGQQSAGHHEMHWNAAGLASGIYMYKVRFENSIVVKKMMLIK